MGKSIEDLFDEIIDIFNDGNRIGAKKKFYKIKEKNVPEQYKGFYNKLKNNDFDPDKYSPSDARGDLINAKLF